MTKDLLVESEIEEKILQKEEVEEKNHHQEREGVEMIVMNGEHPREARI